MPSAFWLRSVAPVELWNRPSSITSRQSRKNRRALAELYQKQSNWEEAKRAAERAHSLDPASPFIANNLAYLYMEHGGDINLALSLAQQARQKLPDSPIVSD